jgi:predicted small secreted protein
MKKVIALLLAGIVGSMVITACATTKGAAVGAGIGALAGDTKKGAAIGASVGTVVGILD